MNRTYAYLVSDGKQVSVTLEKPNGVRVGKVHWKERCRIQIGQAITIYTDDVWVGVLGVYDVSNTTHALQLAKDMRKHTLSLVERRIEDALHMRFGQEASMEVRGYMWAFDTKRQGAHKWSPLGGLLWNISQAMKTICFQGK